MSAHSSGAAAPRRGSAVRARDEVLAGRLVELGTALDGEPDPAFREATRARLVAMAAVRSPEPAAKAGTRRWFGATAVETAGARWRGRLTAGLAGAAVAVTALAGLVAVSTGAQPGDPLYGLKRGTEQTQLALASDSSRGRTLLDFATTRLLELDEVLAADASPELVVQTLQTMDAQTSEGTAWLTTRAQQSGTSAPLDYLSDWAARQSAELSALATEAPEGARTAMGDSLALLGQVEARGAALRDVLGCPAGPAVTGTDALGPVPGTCEEPAPPSAAGGSTTEPDTAPTPEQPATELPPSSPPAGPTPGGGTETGTSPGAGGGAVVPAPPQPTTPSRPSPSLPLPSLPLPALPLPGGSTNPSPGAPSSSTAAPSTSPPLISICLGPIVVGSC